MSRSRLMRGTHKKIFLTLFQSHNNQFRIYILLLLRVKYAFEVLRIQNV